MIASYRVEVTLADPRTLTADVIRDVVNFWAGILEWYSPLRTFQGSREDLPDLAEQLRAWFDLTWGSMQGAYYTRYRIGTFVVWLYEDSCESYPILLDVRAGTILSE